MMERIDPVDRRIDRLVTLAAGVWAQRFQDFPMTPTIAVDLAVETLAEIDKHIVGLFNPPEEGPPR